MKRCCYHQLTFPTYVVKGADFNLVMLQEFYVNLFSLFYDLKCILTTVIYVLFFARNSFESLNGITHSPPPKSIYIANKYPSSTCTQVTIFKIHIHYLSKVTWRLFYVIFYHHGSRFFASAACLFLFFF